MDLKKYDTFSDMFKDYNIEQLVDKCMTKNELLSVLEEFYPKDKPKEYGVLAIKVELI